MDSKKINIIIGVLIVLAIIILIVIFVVIQSNKIDSVGLPDNPYDEVIVQNKLELINSRNDFYTVKSIVDKYYLFLSELNAKPEILELEEGEEFDAQKYEEEFKKMNSDIVYSFLDNEYVKSFAVSETNLTSKLGNYQNITTYIDKMYTIENSTNVATYFVYGITREYTTISKFTEFSLMVTIDKANDTFSIAPQEYINAKKYNNLELGKEFSIGIESIEDKTYNKFEYSHVSDKTIIADYIELYKVKVLYNVKDSYELLDKEYRETKFGSVEKYEQYVKTNLYKINNMRISQYSSEGTENDMTYTCIGGDGNKYIIKEKGIMQFGLILDT